MLSFFEIFECYEFELALVQTELAHYSLLSNHTPAGYLTILYFQGQVQGQNGTV